jgi:hypothetical protein
MNQKPEKQPIKMQTEIKSSTQKIEYKLNKVKFYLIQLILLYTFEA